MINQRLDLSLSEQLKDRVWQDDWAKMPTHLYPGQSRTILYPFWEREYNALFEKVEPDTIIHQLFAPATPAEMQPRYLVDSVGRWYALIGPRYNRRTQRRFCYVRYWQAADALALQEMVQAVLAGWQTVPFGWLKLRLGCGATLEPATIHPQAAIQSYVVAGRVSRNPAQIAAAQKNLADLGLTLSDSADDLRWWADYEALLHEQEQLEPEFAAWADYEATLPHLKREMVDLLKNGGGALNLWAGARLVGHISWEPYTYDEQLIARCWHINNIIVAFDYRRQSLGQALHHLAAERMNLAVTPIVAGLINGQNRKSLRTAAKIGRHIVDSYLTVPKGV
jgi:hypothetical protein